MSGNGTFELRRDLHDWLAAADPGAAPVSLRLRISADVEAEAETRRGLRGGLVSAWRRLSPLVDLVSVGATVGLVILLVVLGNELRAKGIEGSGAPNVITPGGIDTPPSDEFPGPAGVPWPVLLGVSAAAGFVGWLVARTPRFAAIVSRLLAFGRADGESGRVMVPRFRAVPLSAWALTVALLATHVFMLWISSEPTDMTTSFWIQLRLSEIAGLFETLVMIALLLRYERLWRSDPLLFGGFLVYIVGSYAAALVFGFGNAYFGLSLPAFVMEAFAFAVNGAAIVFALGVAHRRSMADGPRPVVAGVITAITVALPLFQYLAFPFWPVTPEMILPFVLAVLNVGFWVVLLWASVGARRRSRLSLPAALLIAGSALQVLEIAWRVVRGFVGSSFIAFVSGNGFADAPGEPDLYAIASVLGIAASAAAWLCIFLAFAIGMPQRQAGETE